MCIIEQASRQSNSNAKGSMPNVNETTNELVAIAKVCGPVINVVLKESSTYNGRLDFVAK
ncbi:hypothetical protein I4U23_021715 [Adineta vaga]|nr:hypothetical protein I4U23_021715 [Adineta vaga]